ncbi:MAG: hypothetical protein QOE91_1470 [Gaiellaceae bacterium]|jgi:uncharacterized membrane protein YeaQ/YmgE (transglycosylase-associated protein family)|nr:hypothetical protein [Gaiellaceae bacterium]
MWIIGIIVSGFIVGGLARFALPGPDPMPWYATIALGVGGALIGGAAFGFLGAFIGAVVLLALYRKFVQHRPVFRA